MQDETVDDPLFKAWCTSIGDLEGAVMRLCICSQWYPVGFRALARYRARRKLAAACRKAEHVLMQWQAEMPKSDSNDAEWFSHNLRSHLKLAKAILHRDPQAVAEASKTLSEAEFPGLHDYLLGFLALWGRSKSCHTHVPSIWERILSDAEAAGSSRRRDTMVQRIVIFLQMYRIPLDPAIQRRLAPLIAGWEAAGFPGAGSWNDSRITDQLLPAWYVARRHSEE